MNASKYTLRGPLKDVIQEISEALDISQTQSIKTDPERGPERTFALLAFLLGAIASLIAWGSEAQFTWADSAYLTFSLCTYVLLCRLFHSRGIMLSLASLGITWALVRSLSLWWYYPSPMVWMAVSLTCLGLANVAPHFFIGEVPRGAVDNGKLDMTLTVLQSMARNLEPTAPIELELDLRSPHKLVFRTFATWSGGIMSYLRRKGHHWEFSQPWLDIKLGGQSLLSVKRDVKVEIVETRVNSRRYVEEWKETGLDLLELRLPSTPHTLIKRVLSEVLTGDYFERQVLTRPSDPWEKDKLTAQMGLWNPSCAPVHDAKLEIIRDPNRLKHGIPGKFLSTQRGLLIVAVSLVLMKLWELVLRVFLN